MKRAFALLTISMAISVLLVPLALTQEPSPALGGYLDLNGVDSYAVCLDSDSLDKDLGDFAIEVWIYPRRKPKRDEWWIIAAKPDSYELAFVGPNDKMRNTHITDFGIIFRVNLDNVAPGDDLYVWVSANKKSPGFPDDFKFNEWHHIVVRYHKKVRWVDGTVSPEMVMFIDGNHVATAGLGKSERQPIPVCLSTWVELEIARVHTSTVV